MKTFASLALKLLTGISSVFIAACYGVPHGLRLVKVVDAQTKAGIPGILVTCLDGHGERAAWETTDGQGEVEIRDPCSDYRAEDVDAAANGSYATKTVPSPASDPIVIELDPIP